MINRRKMTEFGNIALVEQREDFNSVAVGLPGVRKGDMASRAFKPEIKVSSVQFSPTGMSSFADISRPRVRLNTLRVIFSSFSGRTWAAATTEGLLVYSLDNNLVFDPFELQEDITVSRVLQELSEENFASSLMKSLRLNEQDVITQVLENIPMTQGLCDF